jgi:hypothetical protein
LVGGKSQSEILLGFFVCVQIGEIVASSGWSAQGRAELSDSTNQIEVKLIGVLVSLNGTVSDREKKKKKKKKKKISNNQSQILQASTSTLIAHVHAEDCSSNAAGGHFKVNASEPTTIAANELWAGPGGAVPAVQGAAWNGGSTVTGSFTGRQDVKAIVIHEVLADTSAPKRVCCNLAAVVATTVTSGATTTSTTTTTTTAPVAATTPSTVASATPTTTTKAPVASTSSSRARTTASGTIAEGTGDACTTDACCADVAKENDEKKCESCFQRDGCTYYATPNKNPMTTGDCLLSTSEGGGAQTKVTELAQCTIEIGCSAIKSCYECSSEEACNWCHTSTQVLSKDEGRCVSGDCKVDEMQASRINCPSSASTLVVSCMVALVSTVAIVLF